MLATTVLTLSMRTAQPLSIQCHQNTRRSWTNCTRFWRLRCATTVLGLKTREPSCVSTSGLTTANIFYGWKIIDFFGGQINYLCHWEGLFSDPSKFHWLPRLSFVQWRRDWERPNLDHTSLHLELQINKDTVRCALPDTEFDHQLWKSKRKNIL